MGRVRLLMVGDLVLDAPDADGFFELARPTLQSADVLIGHVETPHTTRGVESVGDVPAPASNPANLRALQHAGFHIATLAGNHAHDRGAEGIADTRAHLGALGIAATGAGKNLAEARTPAIVTKNGRRLGVLSYNCVGPKENWAGPARAGCAYVRVITHYEQEMANPGGPPVVYTFAEPASLEAMEADIAAARAQCDTLIVALHKGLVHVPAQLAMYERPVAKATINAGADIVIGHHAHILRGAEVYRGKPIFHGLGNFVTVTRALNIEGNDHPERRAWAEKRRKVFGFEPDPNYPLYPFHPEAKNAMIATCEISDDGAISPGFLPCWMEPTAQPRVLTRSEKGQQVADYVAQITKTAGLNTRFAWDGDRVVFAPAD